MKTLITYLMVLFISFSTFSQIIEKAPEDKAVVYFVRTVKGFAIFENTAVFNEDGPIGILTYRTFIRYECDPGEQLLWVMRTGVSNISFKFYKQFVEAQLQAGKTYVIEVRLQPEGIRVEPVNPKEDLDKMARARTVLNSKSSIKANKILKKRDFYKKKLHKSFTKHGMEEYAKFVEKDKVNRLPSDWCIEVDKLILTQESIK